MPPLSRTTLGALLLLAATAAHAQYVWIGPNGTRQYSDRPPPPGTPTSKIVKAPGRQALEPQAPAADAASDAASKPQDAKAPPTLAERDAAFRERSKARTEQEQKDQEAATRQRRLAEHCATARETQAQLDSGIRIAKIGPDGEKTYMTDEEKAARNERVRRALQECR